jgi:Tol biopolymer transport system component
MVAVPSEDWQGGPNTVEILALDTGTLLHRFARPAEPSFIFQWAPDGKAIDYIQTKGGVTNIWQQPLTGSPPRQLTHFTSDEITDFDLSPDGKQLLLSRGHSSRNVFLLSNFH